MNYLLAKLPEFPEGTLVSINRGFSPNSSPTHGGSGKPFVRVFCFGQVFAVLDQI